MFYIHPECYCSTKKNLAFIHDIKVIVLSAP